eukprot:m.234800 g.234800  ORF g.234800 m.234800 type:complete len:71 (+) comp17090_c4_seq4:153-365(+)
MTERHTAPHLAVVMIGMCATTCATGTHTLLTATLAALHPTLRCLEATVAGTSTIWRCGTESPNGAVHAPT